MKQVYILLGGFVGADGWITSAGMLTLKTMLDKVPDVKTHVYTWSDYPNAAKDILTHPKDKIVVVGYSGGGSRATWLANDNRHMHIDLMVLYDPSPRWQMKSIFDTCVKRCVEYHNLWPMFFGLGGGHTPGPQVETVDISENHMIVQNDINLHRRTVQLISGLN